MKNKFLFAAATIVVAAFVLDVSYVSSLQNELEKERTISISYYDKYELSVESYYDLLESYEGLFNEDFVPDSVDYPNPSYFDVSGKDL